MSVIRAVWAASPPTLRRMLRGLNRSRPANRVRWGNLGRDEPFSQCYGFDRGTPIDRYYIERALEGLRAQVRGRVLEVRDSTYARRYGGAQVAQTVVVDIDASNERADIVGDLCKPGLLADASVDCVILTQTLHLLTEPRVALEQVWRSLAPGGSLIVSAPCVSRVDPESVSTDCWRWTPAGFEAFLSSHCPDATLIVTPFGNALAAVGFLLGLGAQELSEAELALRDDDFPLVSVALAVKASGGAAEMPTA